MISSPDRPDGSSSRRNGVLYAFDARNHRVVAFNKADGKYLEQYRPPAATTRWEDLRGFVRAAGRRGGRPGDDVVDLGTGLHSTLLEAVPDVAAHAIAQRRGLPRRDAEGDQDPQAVTAGRRIRP